MRFPHLRKMSWALISWSVLCLVWIITGVNSANPHGTAEQAGTAIGAGLIFGLWFMGFVVLSLVWFMTRPKDR